MMSPNVSVWFVRRRVDSRQAGQGTPIFCDARASLASLILRLIMQPKHTNTHKHTHKHSHLTRWVDDLQGVEAARILIRGHAAVPAFKLFEREEVFRLLLQPHAVLFCVKRQQYDATQALAKSCLAQVEQPPYSPLNTPPHLF